MFDQPGNVWEWCLDVWNERAYAQKGREKEPLNPIVSEGDKTQRVLRGGSWKLAAEHLRAAFRGKYSAKERINDFGLRVAATLVNR